MENKKISKKALKMKFIMLVFLAALMVVLTLGYVATKGKKADKSKPEQTTAAVQEVETQAVALSETSEENTSDTTAADNTNKDDRKNTVIAITDQENWFLAIINSEHPLPDKYAPTLASVIDSSDVKLDSRVAEKYKQMYTDAKQAGCVLAPYSGYHTFAAQDSSYQRKYNYYLNQGNSEDEAKRLASQKVLPAGCSEHNAGIAMDIGSASVDFQKTKEFQWLSDNAANYGFILRYPEGKTDITGVSYEPWHWRYVGEKAAKEMKASGQCLEEYLGLA